MFLMLFFFFWIQKIFSTFLTVLIPTSSCSNNYSFFYFFFIKQFQHIFSLIFGVYFKYIFCFSVFFLKTFSLSFLSRAILFEYFYCISSNPKCFDCPTVRRVSQGFWGTREHWQNIEGNKGTLANFWKQGTTFRKTTVRKHSERVWEHGNIGQFWKGTREQGPPLGDPKCVTTLC